MGKKRGRDNKVFFATNSFYIFWTRVGACECSSEQVCSTSVLPVLRNFICGGRHFQPELPEVAKKQGRCDADGTGQPNKVDGALNKKRIFYVIVI